SVVVMAGAGAAFAIEWLISRDRPTGRALLITMPVWAAASLVAVAAGRQSMDDFWRQGFFPLPLKSLSDLRWFWDQGLSMFTDPTLLRYPWPALFLIV